MKLLSQNTKMKKSSQNGILVFNWTLPAFQSVTGLKTCPMAGNCAAGCYARMGTYRFSNVAAKHEKNLELSQTEAFVPSMIGEIEKIAKRLKSGQRLMVRIHDAGDFYSLVYLERWVKIMSHFEKNPQVSFYAYSKSIELLKAVKLPDNFRVIYSLGGRQDALIDLSKDYHSKVFETLDALQAVGYVDGTQDDMIAALGDSPKIGLVYHGVKGYAKTTWDKVS